MSYVFNNKQYCHEYIDNSVILSNVAGLGNNIVTNALIIVILFIVAGRNKQYCHEYIDILFDVAGRGNNIVMNTLIILLYCRMFQAEKEAMAGQYEFSFTYADALTTADRHSFMKFMLKVGTSM